MARNGSGTYVLPAGNPVVTGTTISSTWANTSLGDIATALTGSIASDGQTTPTANLPMGNYAHTGVANATVRNMYASAGQVQDGALAYLTSVSGTNTITAIGAVGMSAYVAGQRFSFIAAGNNTGAVTININSAGAKSIVKNGSVALQSGDMASGAAYEIVYDGTNFQLINPKSSTSVSSVSGGSTGIFMASTTAVTATISAGTPAQFTVASSVDVPANGTQITLNTTGVLPTGLSQNVIYYVINASTTTFNVSLTSGGSAVNTTLAGSGTHSFELLSTTGSIEMAGIVNLANGGTGLASITPNAIMVGNGSGALQLVRPDTNNNVLTSTAGATITAGAFVTGVQYTIVSPGTTNFTLIGAANNNAGTVFVATGQGSGNGTASINTWTSAANNKLTSGTSVATTSGTSVSVSTTIPSWVKRITIMFDAISLSGSDNLLVRLGTSGSVASTGYTSTSGVVVSGNNTVVDSNTTGFVVSIGDNGRSLSGTMTIALISGTKWISSHAARSGSGRANTGGGVVDISGTLTQIQLVPTGGNSFANGSVNIMYD